MNSNLDLLIAFGGSIKTLEKKGDLVTVGDYGILWGDSNKTDLEGDWFTPQTNFGARKGLGVDTMLHHGIPLSAKLAKYSGVLLPPTIKAEDDEIGKLVATILDLSDAYQRSIYECTEAKALKWSSGANPLGTRRKDNAKSGEIVQWPLMEFSFTPTPCESRLAGITSLKSLLNPKTGMVDLSNFDSSSFTKSVRVLTDLKSSGGESDGETHSANKIKPEVKGEFLGDGIEEDLSMAALRMLNDRLMYRTIYKYLSPERYNSDSEAYEPVPLPTRLRNVRGALDEFATTAYTIIETIMSGEGEDVALAAKAARTLWSDPDVWERAEGAPALKSLQGGLPDGLPLAEHSEQVLAAEQEFCVRIKSLLDQRCGAEGRSLSRVQKARLLDHIDGMESLKGIVQTLLEYGKSAGQTSAVVDESDPLASAIAQAEATMSALSAPVA